MSDQKINVNINININTDSLNQVPNTKLLLHYYYQTSVPNNIINIIYEYRSATYRH
jgi:hypothetical protein